MESAGHPVYSRIPEGAAESVFVGRFVGSNQKFGRVTPGEQLRRRRQRKNEQRVQSNETRRGKTDRRVKNNNNNRKECGGCSPRREVGREGLSVSGV